MRASEQTARLIEGLRKEDPAAQEEFLRHYAPMVFGWIARLTRNEMDAEELTQDTLLRAMRYAHSFDPSKASLETWLSRIAYRLTLNRLRIAPTDTISIDDAPAAMTKVDARLVASAFQDTDAQAIDLLEQAIDHLTPLEQTLITLFYYDELPLKEIAYVVDAPPGTIATRLHRIRKKLYLLIQKLRQL